MPLHGEYKMPGGKLIVADLAVREGRLAGVSISGDFFLEPDTALQTINDALENLPAGSGERVFAATVAAALPRDANLYGISAAAVAVAVRRALESSA